MKTMKCVLIYCACIDVVWAADLLQLWNAAEQHSADYAAARYGRDAVQEQEKQARAALFPHVALKANWQKQPESLSNSKSSAGWQVELTQDLFNASKHAQYRQSKYNSQFAQKRLEHEQETVLLNISETYFNYLLASDVIRSAQREQKSYEQQLKQAKMLFNKGAATALDVYEAQAGYDQAYAKEAAAIAQQHRAANQLSSDTGIAINEVEDIPTENLAKNYLPVIQQYKLPQWQALALQHNREYQAQKAQVKSSLESLNAAKNRRLPVVSGNLSYSDYHHVYRNHVGQRGKGLSLSVNISIPLFSAGEQSSQIRENSARYHEAEQRLLALERKIKLAVQQAYINTLTSVQQINAQKRLLASNQEKLKASKTGQKYGLRNQLEVLQAQQEVASSEQQLSQANYQFLTHYLTLIKESGLGLRQVWQPPK